jgi:hypothetical protein
MAKETISKHPDDVRSLLRDMVDWYLPRPGEGIGGAVDRWGMQFYRETGNWPAFKSPPLEIYHPLSPEERSRAYSKWCDQKKQEFARRAAAVLGDDLPRNDPED